MHSISVFLSLCLVGCSQATSIIGGSVAGDGQWPWAAALTIHRPHDEAGFCGGTLISDQWILTTAHCMNKIGGAPAKYFEIVLGTADIGNMNAPGTKHFNSTEGHIHPDWINSGNWIDNDIGVIKLPEPVEFTDFIRPACLPTLADMGESYSGVMATAIGWGKTSTASDSHSDLLYFVEVEVMSNALCQADYGPMVNDGHMCIDTQYGRVGICGGDSGSALQVYDGGCWKVIGVAAWINKGLCEDGKPQGFQRVTYHLDWINQITTGSREV